MAKLGTSPTCQKKIEKRLLSAVRAALVAKAVKWAVKRAVKPAARPVAKLDLPKAAKVVKADLILPTLAKEVSALSLLMVAQPPFLPLVNSSSRATLPSE